MPGFYHVLQSPVLTDAFDNDPDPIGPAGDGLAGTPEEQLARARRRKARVILLGFGPAQLIDELGGRWSKDMTKVLLETDAPHDISTLRENIRPLVLLSNQTRDQILAYLSADPNWAA